MLQWLVLSEDHTTHTHRLVSPIPVLSPTFQTVIERNWVLVDLVARLDPTFSGSRFLSLLVSTVLL